MGINNYRFLNDKTGKLGWASNGTPNELEATLHFLITCVGVCSLQQHLKNQIYILIQYVKLKKNFFNIQKCDYPITGVLIVQFDMRYFARVCESSVDTVLWFSFLPEFS